MANNLGSLVVSLGLDAAEFTRGLSKSEYQTQQWVRRFETGIEAARTGALAAFAAMGTAAAVLDRQLNSIAGFQDLADKMGDTAQEVASLKLAFDLSGVSAETAAAASVKLTSALAKTDDESKGVGAALKAIGLEMDEFKRLTPVAQIDAVAQALAGFEDGAGKTAVAVQLFGKSGADLIPMLNDLAEEGGRQVTLTGQQIAAADEYSKSTARLRSEVQTLVAVTAADAAPVLTQMVQILRDTTAYSTSGAGGVSLLTGTLLGAKTALETVLVVGSQVASVFREIGDFAGAYAAVSVALIKGDVDGAKAIGAAYRELSSQRLKALDDYQSKVMGGQSGFWRMPTLGTDAPQASYSNEGRNYAQRPKAIQFTPYVPRAGGGSASTGKTAAEKAQQDYDDFVRKTEEDRVAYLGRRAEQQLREQDEIEKRYIREQAEFEAAAGEYVYQRNLKRWEDEQKAREDLAKKAADAQAAQVERLGDAFSNTFDTAFREGMKVGDLIKKLAFDAINIQFLTPATQKAGNWLGSTVSSIFKSFDGGGYTGSGSRSGGIDGKGGFLSVLHPNETVLDHTKGQGMGGGATAVIQQTFNFGNASADTVAQLRAEAARIKAETLAAVPAAVLQARRTSTGFAAALRGA